METRELLRLLMERAGDNPNALAAKLKNAATQPQIYKFLAGISKEPRRSTLQPVADHYGVSIDAFYDEDRAQQEWDRLNGRARPVAWPFSKELQEAVKSAPIEKLEEMENLMRVILKMPALPPNADKRKQA